MDTSNVLSWTGTFAITQSIERLDLIMLDTSSAIHIRWMFYGNTKLKEVNIDGWDTSKLRNATGISTDPGGRFF